MRLVSEALRRGWEVDVFISENGRFHGISVERVNDIEHAVDKGAQLNAVRVILALRQVQTREEGLMDQRLLVLPSGELTEHLLQESMFVG